MSESFWFYIDVDESTIGPLSFRDMDVLLRTDSINLSTLAWNEGMETWQHIGQIPEFIQNLAENDIEIALHMKTSEVPLPVLTEESKVLESQKSQELKRAKHKRQKEKKLKKWYTPKLNTNLYISGMPKGITVDTVKEFFSKAGIIRVDKFTGMPKIKLYHDESGNLKGDGLVSYMNSESLAIAVSLLENQEIAPGYKVHMEPAEFSQKGDYVARKKVQVNKLELIKAKSIKEKLLGWDEENESKGLRIVILTNVFSLETFNQGFKEKLQKFMEEKIGEVERVKVFQNNPDGVVEVKFKKASDAETCIEGLNEKEVLGRVVKCFYWDGKTDYMRVWTRQFKETPEEEEKRIQEFADWLEDSESEEA